MFPLAATFDARQGLSAAVLAGVALAFALAWIWSWRRSPFNFVQYLFYSIHIFYTRIVWRGTINKPLPVKPGQGAVIVCNHIGPLDPAFVALGADRIVHWMVAREFCDHPLFGWGLRKCEVIPVNRGGVDTAATKHAIRLLEAGELVGMFPEGRINTTKDLLQPGRPGAALVALKARVPVIPCFVTGSPYDGTTAGCFLMTARGHCEVGDPIDLSPYYDRDDSKDVLQELTKRFLVEMARLAGVDEFQPKLAGRRWKHGESVIDEAEANGHDAPDADAPRPAQEPAAG